MNMKDFKDFFIRVGQPGAWSKNMVYPVTYGVYRDFGIMVKHAPYNMYAPPKNYVEQDWPDEDGKDIYLPTDSDGNPAIAREQFDYEVQFVYHKQHSGETDWMKRANGKIKGLLSAIEGRWLQIQDTYTGVAYDGVILKSIEEDPVFKRRNFDTVIFSVVFSVNHGELANPIVANNN